MAVTNTGRGAARDYIADRFGATCDDTEKVVTTGATSVKAAASDPDALAHTFINLGANAVYLGLGPDVSATKGIYLAPNGGTAAIVLDEDMTLVTRDWYAISPAGASTLYVLKVRAVTRV